MSRKAKTIIIVLAALVLLAGGYYGATAWQKYQAANAPSPYAYLYNSDPLPRLGNLDSYEIAKIEVPNMVLERINERWELISLDGRDPPEGVDLDQSMIRNMTYSLASIWVDRVLEDNPEDISIYGLDRPFLSAIVTESGGKSAEYLVGDMTPSRNSYYFMEKGDPAVYIISNYTAMSLLFDLDYIRQKSIFPNIDLSLMTQFRVESPDMNIAISIKEDELPPHLGSAFTSHIMTSPYELPRGVDNEALYKVFESLNNLQLGEIIEDSPASLVPYGLDKPVRFYIETIDDTLDLLIGDSVAGRRYAKLADSPRVFTLSGLDTVLSIKPFTLMDKFALLVNIITVDHLSVTGGGERPLSVDFQDPGEDWETFYLNGRRAETKSFKTFYQAVIGLLSDAEYPGPARNPAPQDSEPIVIEYELHTYPGERVFITLVPYDREFYALIQGGAMEFLISRNQVRRIWETADALIYW